MNAVEIEKVTKAFGNVTAVDHLSLRIAPGSICGFIGPNGSGKTTTLRMIMNIFYPDSGTIRVFGDERREAADRRIGYLPEDRGLYKKMKVRDLLRFFGEMKSGRRVDAEVDDWLEKLDLAAWAGKKIETLSKGMGQKVQFIAAVVPQPDLILLDEPFTGLDPVNVETIKNAILDLRSRGATVIFSTHDMNVAEKMCDFIIMIFKGRKVLDGTLGSIQAQYGRETLRIQAEGGISRLADLPGVEKAIDFGRLQELRVRVGADHQKILAEIMSRTRVLGFESAPPTLYDIFLRIAGPEAEGVSHA